MSKRPSLLLLDSLLKEEQIYSLLALITCFDLSEAKPHSEKKRKTKKQKNERHKTKKGKRKVPDDLNDRDEEGGVLQRGPRGGPLVYRRRRGFCLTHGPIT